MMFDRETLQLIQKLPIFSSLSLMEQRKLAGLNDLFHDFPKGGTFIMEEGTQGDSFHIIIQGMAFVKVEAAPNKILARLKPGAICGEIAYLTGGKRSSSVVTQHEEVRTLVITHRMFRTLGFDVRDKIKDGLIDVLVSRAVDMTDTIVDLKKDIAALQKEIIRLRKASVANQAAG
ncbi:MAG: cyclic nucleotide-binding domain-containing protein [Magnetococcales bacterium]|nr:cyclic nucleotide-binding domain-containing protein [Magnetococcales bacterium]